MTASTTEPLAAPFPWFGGKSRAAPLLWSRFGDDCGNYVEPFLGSAAVFLARPATYKGWATLNDIDGNIANFWRAAQLSPAETALHACQPVNECDLHARHLWLVTHLPALSARLMADPAYHDPRAAGWWAWGACSWIGGGWCDGSGPWTAQPDHEGVPALARTQSPNGVNRRLPHLSNFGNGVNRSLPRQDGCGSRLTATPANVSTAAARLAWLGEWFSRLAASLDGVRIACGDWSRITSLGTITRNGPAAVLLDPPYSLTAAVYARDSSTVSADARAWAIANGPNPLLRIALCGHDTEHDTLAAHGWTVATWPKGGGYQGADARERIWFSPHCLPPHNPQPELF